jgi:hypothetical protein
MQLTSLRLTEVHVVKHGWKKGERGRRKERNFSLVALGNGPERPERPRRAVGPDPD